MSSDPQNESKSPKRTIVTRRNFLLGLTGSALAAAAGCRPAGMTIPTPYVPGSATLTPMPSSTPAPTRILTANSAADPNYGEIVFDQIFTTPTDRFYVTQYNYNKTPTVDGAAWTLKIDGLVESPVTLNLEDIKKLPSYEEMRTLECIGNPVGGALIGNATWKGCHLEPLLAQVKISPTATHARFYADDGYATSVKVEYINQANVMLAYEMNGAILDKTHGFPLRIMMPGLYGQKMPRWLTRIEFIDKDYIGYWESNGYSNIATVNTNSQIKSPPAGESATPVEAGKKVQIQGVAYAAPRLITNIDVRIEGGEWMPAKITRGPNKLTWAQWRFEWVPPSAGAYRIAVRATDETGFTQSADAGGLFGDNSRDGTTAIHEITVRAVEPKA